MGVLKSATLGVIACPGAEKFTSEIISHMRGIYNRKYDKISTMLAEKYDFTKERAIRELNLETELHSGVVHRSRNPEKLIAPKFKLPVKFTRFANGEFKAELQSSIRGMDIFIVQDVENHYPLSFNGADEKYRLTINDHLFILFATIDAVMQAGASTVTVTLPTYPFSRQHRKKGREAMSASMFGRILEFIGVKRIITLDIHSKEIENTFRSLRLENLHASYQILKPLTRLLDLKTVDMAVVSPDTGAIDRNKYYANNLRMPLALLYKERDYAKVTKSAKDNNITDMRLLGSVSGKVVFMADDLLGTGGTLVKAMRFLKTEGATRIIGAVSLPLFTGNAVECLDEAYKEGLFTHIIGTNAVFHDETLLSHEWFVQANISNLFAQVIFRLHHNRSLSALLDNSKIIQRLLNE